MTTRPRCTCGAWNTLSRHHLSYCKAEGPAPRGWPCPRAVGEPLAARREGQMVDPPEILTVEDIAAIQRAVPLGRDEEGRRTTIGLAEFDALCATARAGAELVDLMRTYIAGDAGDPTTRRHLAELLALAGLGVDP